MELPILLENDNKGAVDLANNWSLGGQTRHVDVRNHFLWELKDEGLIMVKHVPYLGMKMWQTSLPRILLHRCSTDTSLSEESHPEPGAREGVGA